MQLVGVPSDKFLAIFCRRGLRKLVSCKNSCPPAFPTWPWGKWSSRQWWEPASQCTQELLAASSLGLQPEVAQMTVHRLWSVLDQPPCPTSSPGLGDQWTALLVCKSQKCTTRGTHVPVWGPLNFAPFIFSSTSQVYRQVPELGRCFFLQSWGLDWL